MLNTRKQKPSVEQENFLINNIFRKCNNNFKLVKGLFVGLLWGIGLLLHDVFDQSMNGSGHHGNTSLALECVIQQFFGYEYTIRKT